MGGLTFDPQTHEYVWGGRVIPSVTSLIGAAGLLGAGQQFYTAASAARGRRVHLACAERDAGREAMLPPDDAGFLDSYLTWRTLMQPTWTRIEEPRYAPRYDTAGTADRIGTVGGRPLVLDLKTGGPAKWHGLQLAMYDLLHDDLLPQQRRRIALYLRIDGRLAQSVEYLDPADYTLALILMQRTDTNDSDRPPDVTRHADAESEA